MIDTSELIVCWECGAVLFYSVVVTKPGEGVCTCPVCKKPLREKP